MILKISKFSFVYKYIALYLKKDCTKSEINDILISIFFSILSGLAFIACFGFALYSLTTLNSTNEWGVNKFTSYWHFIDKSIIFFTLSYILNFLWILFNHSLISISDNNNPTYIGHFDYNSDLINFKHFVYNNTLKRRWRFLFHYFNISKNIRTFHNCNFSFYLMTIFLACSVNNILNIKTSHVHPFSFLLGIIGYIIFSLMSGSSHLKLINTKGIALFSKIFSFELRDKLGDILEKTVVLTILPLFPIFRIIQICLSTTFSFIFNEFVVFLLAVFFQIFPILAMIILGCHLAIEDFSGHEAIMLYLSLLVMSGLFVLVYIINDVCIDKLSQYSNSFYGFCTRIKTKKIWPLYFTYISTFLIWHFSISILRISKLPGTWILYNSKIDYFRLFIHYGIISSLIGIILGILYVSNRYKIDVKDNIAEELLKNLKRGK